MGDLVLLLIPEMIGLIITPAAIAGCVLLLQSNNPMRNALSFAGAFLFVYSMIGLAALIGGAGDPSTTSRTFSHWIGLVVGLLFLAVGLAQLLQRRKLLAEKPNWMIELEKATPRRAFLIGLLLANLNPNLFIMMSGLSIIASSGPTWAQALVGTALLLLAAMVDFLLPIGAYLALGARARRGLDAVKSWMVRRNKELGVAVFLGFGALFTIRGALALAS
ncbi:GAP family protein [Rhodococcus sp. NPDC127528]|uniref:GAP family protein n=1 Tax=unclassified Rhodococcus (in: high G+C Gram-positive bacteria) TaxID=192944 RepID=UPI00363144B7